ncbi:hypothetical protein ABIA39_001507 [Nocardia sp. GAS34]|uniref:ABC transporter permease n=1 Tax=unclassified Nocardia TaxID=2637762 RepID=UPI003D1B30DB
MALADIEVPFRLRGTGLVLHANGNELAQISAAIATVTMIIGFMMFAATFSSGAFDRRLSMAGYPRGALALAKIACLVVASLVVCAYATAVICCFWPPRQPVVLAAALFCAAMTYGALGVALGALLRREVEGMFAITMFSCVDMAVENPIASVGANSEFVHWLPSYGAMQAATAAGFSDTTLLAGFAVQLTWFTASALAGLAAFHLRTRSSLRPVIVARHTPRFKTAGVFAPRLPLSASTTILVPGAPPGVPCGDRGIQPQVLERRGVKPGLMPARSACRHRVAALPFAARTAMPVSARGYESATNSALNALEAANVRQRWKPAYQGVPNLIAPTQRHQRASCTNVTFGQPTLLRRVHLESTGRTDRMSRSLH